MQERSIEVDPSTIMRWVHRYAPELEKRVRWYQGYRVSSWRMDETYVKVGGKWKYLFRAFDKHGRLIDFMLTNRRNTRAAYRFLGKALTTMRHWPPFSITTDDEVRFINKLVRCLHDRCLTERRDSQTCVSRVNATVPEQLILPPQSPCDLTRHDLMQQSPLR